MNIKVWTKLTVEVRSLSQIRVDECETKQTLFVYLSSFFFNKILSQNVRSTRICRYFRSDFSLPRTVVCARTTFNRPTLSMLEPGGRNVAIIGEWVLGFYQNLI